VRFQRKDTEQYHVCIGAPGISRSDRRRFAASLLDAILGGSASSRLFQEIREKRGMAYSVYSFLSQYTDTGLVGLYVGTREENLAQCLEIAAEQIADLAAGNVRPEELARAKENIKGRIMLSMESTSNRMSRLGKSLITDTELLTFERLITEIDAVDAEAVSELAALLLAAPRLSASGIGPSEDVFRAACARLSPGLEAAAAA
jgi:predicted Zn-dependent peptidase